MDAAKADGVFKPKVGNEKVMKREDCGEQNGYLEEDKKRKGVGCDGGGSGKKGSGVGGSLRCCQAEKCTADLSDAKQYHRRHKVCEYHAKAQVVLVGGIRQRFCQQCSRFGEVRLLGFIFSSHLCAVSIPRFLETGIVVSFLFF